MTTLYQKIGEEFLSRLANSKEIDSNRCGDLELSYLEPADAKFDLRGDRTVQLGPAFPQSHG